MVSRVFYYYYYSLKTKQLHINMHIKYLQSYVFLKHKFFCNNDVTRRCCVFQSTVHAMSSHNIYAFDKCSDGEMSRTTAPSAGEERKGGRKERQRGRGGQFLLCFFLQQCLQKNTFNQLNNSTTHWLNKGRRFGICWPVLVWSSIFFIGSFVHVHRLIDKSSSLPEQRHHGGIPHRQDAGVTHQFTAITILTEVRCCSVHWSHSRGIVHHRNIRNVTQTAEPWSHGWITGAKIPQL